MKKVNIAILILVLSIPFYIIVVNFVANEMIYKVVKDNNVIDGAGDVVVNVDDLVSVEIQRNRWYGTIYEQYGDEVSIENLYLFNFIKIPIKVNGVNWSWYHIGTIGTLIFIIFNILIISFFVKKRNNTQSSESHINL